VEDRSKYKYKHYHIYICVYNVFPKVELLEMTKGGEKEGKNDRG
jgi:hypothetical protein